jgi:hypothetical protein
MLPPLATFDGGTFIYLSGERDNHYTMETPLYICDYNFLTIRSHVPSFWSK